ncbi:Sensor histidine kinase YycG [Sulfitobacter sp. THAF37]|nr:Sensor histidine kinase YycG [Sulfitobacter sp. THAF37]
MRKLELLLGAACLVVSVALFSLSLNQIRQKAETEFSHITEEGVESLQHRMQTYLQSLYGLAAYLNASEIATEAEFETFAETLNLDEVLVGINGVGFIEPVQSEDMQAFLGRSRVHTRSDFDVHPKTEGPEHFVITRISPLARNIEALGLDITFEEGRYEAARRARQTGEPQLTPRILLVQDETRQPGFLLLLPLWERVFVPERGGSVRGDFRGWVYAPFVGQRLLTDLSPNQGRVYQIAVFDGPEADPEKIIFDSTAGVDRGDGAAAPAVGKHAKTYTIMNHGRPWTLVFRSTPMFDSYFPNNPAFGILAAGILLTAMLLFVIRSLRVRGEAMAQIADLRARQVSAQEEANRAVIHNAVIPVFILNAEGHILFANQAAHDCFGYPAHGLIDLQFDDLVTDLKNLSEDQMFNASGTRLDGQGLILDLQRNSWVTYEGADRTTALVRDLTAEYEAIEETTEMKARYDKALQGARIGVFDIDLATGRSEVSDTWRQIMGFDDDNSPADPQRAFLERIHPDDLPILEKSDRDCIEQRAPRSIAEYRVKVGEDDWRWMRSDAVVVERDETGRALRMIGAQTDVTKLRHERNALEASENQLLQVFASAPIGMVLLDENGKFHSVNPAFCALCGYDEDALVSAMRMSNVLPRAEVKTIASNLTEMLESGCAQVYSGQHRFIHRNGEERWCLLHISWFFDKNAGRNSFIAQVNDITELKKVEQMKNEFVATVSHELRTPLTSIKGALGLIGAMDDFEVPAKVGRLLEIARSNADNLADIVNDILDLEKISSGEIAFEFHPNSMNSIIRDTADELAPFAVAHKNTLMLDLPPDDLMVLADRGRTRQVLANLISNACKYSDPGTQVMVKAEAVSDQILVCVQNIGPAIPETFRHRIFDAFTQADSSDTRTKGGTGLGLNIAKRIVRRHDGDIGFESTGQGVTVFWFTFPRHGQTSVGLTGKRKEKRQNRPGKLNVLHVEDDSDFAEVLQSGLSDVADLHHVRSLAEARAALAKGPLDVIILDWLLPDGDAVTLLDEIAELDYPVRVLGLSSDAERGPDGRISANLVKSRAEMATIAEHVLGQQIRAS